MFLYFSWITGAMASQQSQRYRLDRYNLHNM